jgi:NADH-quinone oxidoreductase subunit N
MIISTSNILLRQGYGGCWMFALDVPLVIAMTPDYASLARALLPETFLIGGALAVLGLDLAFFRRCNGERRLRFALGVAALAVAVALGRAICTEMRDAVFGGVFMFDSLALATRCGVLVLVLLVLGVSAGGRVPRNPSEYVALLLFAATGFTLMAAAQQLLVVFLALELASLSLYVLAGFDLSRRESAEAALKYFLFGGMSAAFLLFGFSLIYGLTGSIELPRIAYVLAHQPASPLLEVALIMILVSFGFKMAAAPFHLWAPDAYEGAPAPAAALIASASKLSALVLFTRLLWTGFGSAGGNFLRPGWVPTVALLAGASMMLGNLAALAQTNVRRLLAYSAIAHAGSLMLGVITVGTAGPGPVFYYAATYGFATVGAFAVVERVGECQRITDLAGLYRRSPLLAGCLLVFILSLAGIPPLAGFFGKFFVFSAAFNIGGLAGPAGLLALAALLLSIVSLYYYLLILKQALVLAPPANAPRIETPSLAALALITCAALIILLGVFPSTILGIF